MECAEPDRTKPDHAKPNQGLHPQIIMWDLRYRKILYSVEW